MTSHVWKVSDRMNARWEIYDIVIGGMGVIYVVYDHEEAEVFAAKTFKDTLLAIDPSLADRFLQEAQTWVSLDTHPNVAAARFVSVIDRKPFVFVEYVTGGSLRSWIGTQRLLEDLPQILRFAIQVCDGMTHMTSKGIQVHRDLKPENCLITHERTLKLTDFGIAKAFGRMHTLRPVTGTAKYMAPEEFDEAESGDARVDIYSFGVMLYEMLMGDLPFRGERWQDLQFGHKTLPVPPVSTQDVQLSRLVACCLAKRPGDRLGSFTETRGWLSEIYERTVGESYPALPVVGVPNAAELHTKGASLGALGRHAEALACCDVAIELEPGNSLAWLNRANALGGLGRLDDAIQSIDRALALSPNCRDAWLNKGLLLRRSGLVLDAIVHYEHAISLDPIDPDPWANKGRALDDLGRLQEAIECFDRALEIDPRHAVAAFNRGNTLRKLGLRDDAVASYDRALDADSRLYQALVSKAVVLHEGGRAADALRCLDRALEVNQRDSEIWFNRGNSLATLARHSEAIVSYDEALVRNPRHAKAWYNKGAVLANIGQDCREALTCFEEALRLGDHLAEAGIADCRRRLGRSR